MLKKIEAILLLMAITATINAQYYPTKLVLTPNAANLCKYGDIPMNYFTGRTNIAIPIFSTTQRNVTLDVNLTYDTGGINMNTLPSWTGHGWTLNAGGVISRVVMGEPDEIRNIFAPASNNIADGYTDLGARSNYFHCHDSIRQMIRRGMTMEQITNRIDMDYDVCPDIFYFNFMGKTGHFVLGNDGQWKVISDANLDVVFDITSEEGLISPFIQQYPGLPEHGSWLNQPKTIKGFTIIDEEGTEYVFGGDNSAIEYSVELFNTSRLNDGKMFDKQLVNSWVANSWYLKQVKDRFGVVLYEFSYQRGPFIAQLFNSDMNTGRRGIEFRYTGSLSSPVYLQMIRTHDEQNIHFFSAIDGYLTPEVMYSSFYENGVSKYKNKFEISEWNRIYMPCIYLQSSDYAQYQHVPSAYQKNDPLIAARLKRLNKIMISQLSNPDSPTLLPIKSYYFEYDYTFRMHISKIDVKDNHNSSIGKYDFTYNGGESNYPDYLTTNIDSCGYYNRVDYYASNFNYGVQDTVYTQIGVLNTIKYPTGGMTKIEYEHNRVNPTHLSFGVRVKRIKDYDSQTAASGAAKVREFRYPNVSFSMPNHGIGPDSNADLDSEDIAPVTYMTPVIPMYTSFTQHVGYGTVEELLDDGTKTTYHFKAYRRHPISNNSTAYDKLNARSVREGKLLSREVERNDTLIERTDYYYRNDCVTDSIIYAGLFRRFTNDAFVGIYAWWAECIYKLYYPKYNVSKKVEGRLCGDDWVEEVTCYDNHDYCLSIQQPYSHKAVVRKCIAESVSRNGDVFKVTHHYPCQHAYNASSGDISQIYAQHLFNPELSTATYYNSSLATKDSTKYSYSAQRWLPTKVLRYSGTSTSPSVVSDNIQHTSSGLASSWLDSEGVSNRLVWNSKSQLIARIRGPYSGASITFSEPDHDADPAGIDSYTAVLINGNDIFSLPLVDADVYTYTKNGQVSSVRSSNGNIQYYQYDGSFRLSKILDRDKKTLKTFHYNYKNRTF